MYLYPSEAAAEDGERIGGSGFLAGIPIDPLNHNDCLPAVVTNKHVIDHGNMVVRLNATNGKPDTIALDGERWFTHPNGDDLAVCLIGLNKALHKYIDIPPGYFCDRGRVQSLNVGPGDDCFVVGRFISREGKQLNTPAVRFGCIAQMPGEPIAFEDGTRQESYLIEARSIPGYSGAPVFIEIPQAPTINIPLDVPEPTRTLMIEQIYGKLGQVRSTLPIPVGPWLLGIDFCHIHGRDKIFSKATGEPVNDWFVKSNSGMMGVIPVWKLEDILQGDEMKPAIEAARAAIRAKRSKDADQASKDVASDDAPPPASDENPTHREDFDRLLGKASTAKTSD